MIKRYIVLPTVLGLLAGLWAGKLLQKSNETTVKEVGKLRVCQRELPDNLKGTWSAVNCETGKPYAQWFFDGQVFIHAANVEWEDDVWKSSGNIIYTQDALGRRGRARDREALEKP